MRDDERPATARLSAKQLALLQQRLRGEADPAAGRHIPRRRGDGEAPLSFAQQRLWFLDQLVPDSPFYNILNAVRVPQALSPRIVEASVREIVRRHEVLRARFVLRDGEPVQAFASPDAVELRVVDLRGRPEREAELAQLANAEARRPFDLAGGSPIRTVLVQLDAAESVFIVTMHHIVSDGWSMGIFFRELNALYEAFALGRPSPLPELAVQYADYAAWQREQLDDELKARQLAYWRRQLHALPTLELVTDRPRGAVQTFRGAYVPVTIDASLSDAIRRLSRATGATVFMTMLAAFKALLFRYTAQRDVVVGSPIAGRNRTELEPLIGFFVNTLVLRTRLSGDMPFREALRRVQETALGAYSHQDLPFEMLVEEVQEERDLSRNPLFQVMFQVLSAAPNGGSAGAPASPPVEVTVETAKFDLTVALNDGGGEIAGSLEYNTDLFDRPTVERLAEHYRRLLAAVAADPGTPLAELDLVTPGERARLRQLNATRRDYPRDRGVHELFAEQARRTPAAPAVTDGDRALAYGELDLAANRLAHVLRRAGASDRAPVGVLLGRSLEQVAATLAALKAGTAYLPLDPSYPTARIAAMLADAAVSVVATTRAHRDVLADWDGAVVLLDGDAEAIDGAPGEAPAAAAAAGERVAYVMYTSGSTGGPKGIAVPHRAIARLVCNTDYVALGPGDRVAHASNCSFDAATFETWGALLNGAEVVVASPETTLSFQEFGRFLLRGRIDVLFVTTALFNQLAQHVPWAFEGVRDLLFGGEAVDPRWVRAVLEQARPRRLLHVYGPTESTTFASWHPVTEVPPDAATVPIGGPVANTTLHVLDERLEPVPEGVPGSLFIGGDGLAHGYAGRPGLTAERFVPDPFASSAGARMYRTGDTVRRRADGALEFLGRADDQVKLRGFRIELGEIKGALERHAAVAEAFVTVREDRPGDRRIVAYVVARGDTPAADDELRAVLRERLPDYMVPAAFVALPALPLTPNGKIDRAALPPPADERAERTADAVAPRTPNERLLAGMWRDALGVELVGVDDNFFDLGGHSLLMAKVHARLTEVVAHRVTMIDLFQYPTIRSLARHIDGLGVAPTPVVAPEPARREVEDRAALRRGAMARRAASERRRRAGGG